MCSILAYPSHTMPWYSQAAEKVSQALRDKGHEEEGEPVSHPEERDILFGRGGQTNQHPGENRPR